MLHPAWAVEATFAERIDGHVGTTGNPLFSQHFYETDASRGFVRGYTMVLYGAVSGPLGFATGNAGTPVSWGAGHHEEMRRRFGHEVAIVIMGDDLPDSRNRVDLDSEAKDSSGMPGARVAYTYSENSLRMLRHGGAMARRVLEAAGAREIRESSAPAHFAHLLGTARMGSDPRTSVVNAWNQAHDVANLFVVDGSSFTTGAGVNPTSTIGALALRAADGIWDRRREWA
jgi:choline dehydrogenase-like flavoprotein